MAVSKEELQRLLAEGKAKKTSQSISPKQLQKSLASGEAKKVGPPSSTSTPTEQGILGDLWEGGKKWASEEVPSMVGSGVLGTAGAAIGGKKLAIPGAAIGYVLGMPKVRDYVKENILGMEEETDLYPAKTQLEKIKEGTAEFLTEDVPDYLAREGPSILGGIAGGVAGAAVPPPLQVAAVPFGASLGSMLGEAGRQFVSEPEISFEEALRRTGEAGAFGILQEAKPAAEILHGGVRKIGKTAAEAIEEFKEIAKAEKISVPYSETLPLTLAERLNSPLLGKAEGIVENVATSMGIMSEFRKKQMSIATGRYTDAMLDTVSRFRGTPYEIGQKVQQAWKKADDLIRQEADPLYRSIDKLVNVRKERVQVGVEEVVSGILDASGNPTMVAKPAYKDVYKADVMVEVKGIKKWAEDLLERLGAESELVDETKLNSTRKLLTKLAKAPNEVTFTGAQGARSTMLGISRDISDPKVAGIAKSLSGKLDSSMTEAAENSDVPGLKKMVRDANAHWRKYNEVFRKSVLKRLMDPDVIPPEKAHHIFSLASVDDIKTIMDPKITPPEELKKLKARIVQDWVQESTTYEAGTTVGGVDYLGQLTGAAPPPVSGSQLSGKKFTQMAQKFGEDKFRTLYSEAERKAIESYARATSRIGMFRRNTWLSVALNSWLAISVSRMITGDFTRAVDAFGIWSATRRGAKIVTSQEPTFIGSLIEGAKTLPKDTWFQFVKAMAKTTVGARSSKAVNQYVKAMESGNVQRIKVTLGRVAYHLAQNTEQKPPEGGEEVSVSTATPPPSLKELNVQYR